MNTPNRFSMRPVIIFLVIALLIASFSGLLMPRENSPQVEYSQVLAFFREERVTAFSLKDTELTLQLKEPYKNSKTVYCSLGDAEVFHRDLDALIAEQYAGGILSEYDYPPADEPSIWVELLPTILIAVLLGVVMLFVLGRMNGGPGGMASFTKADVQFGAGKTPVTFSDVAGADEEKEELAQIVDFLKDPKRFSEMGARIPKGVLLVGPPGTGKTLLARAVAGEAGVAFLSISGSDFVELYVGVGASRVRSLFEQAKKLAPAIVFIDEIDAVGRQRGSGLGGGHDEREQTLNQLLVEMDGFGKNEGIIVMAATNRKDILDPALLRPGRFDRQIYIGTPDWRGRTEILKIHARDKRLADDVDLSVIAKATAGFTGADLENLLNEGALLAVSERHPAITMADLEQSIIKVIAGPEKKSRVISEHERKLTAYHEAGHAVSMHFLPTQDPVHHITIMPHGAAGGMTISLPNDDANYLSRNEMFETIVSLMGGRVAEALKLHDISTGASNDIDRATQIARDMVSKYGMSPQIGPVNYSSGDEIFVGRSLEKTKPYSERVAGDIDEEVHRILQKAYERCEKILQEQDEKLEAVSQFLLEHNTMDRAQFESIMNAQT